MSDLALRLIAEAKRTNARRLDLGKCGLKRLPKALFELVELEELFLCNRFWDIEKRKWVNSENHGSANHFSTIPDQIKALKKLQVLYLGGDPSDRSFSIENINGLQHLTQLNSLYLSDNNISDIEGLKHLTKLNSLYLSGNKQIKDFEVLKHLNQLNSLYLRNNNISDIEGLKHLTKLNSLDLRNNNISDIEGLKHLNQLNSLDLSDNNISDIEGLKHLTKLNSLDLRNNKISTLKPILPLLKKGIKLISNIFNNPRTINVYENPCTSPPPEIIKQGNAAVISYFEELDQQGVDHIYEAKLLIVGRGGSGKTTLARKLIDPDAPMPTEEETTKGIDIQPLIFPLTKAQDFTINIWDFGGQEIYHATHQFFLTKRSLYILLDDTREDDKSSDEGSFNYWLQTIELFGGNSPVLIVQNEKANRSKAIDLPGMKAQYGFLKDQYPTNLLTTRGLKELKEAIQFYIQQLPHIGEALPKQWLLIRKELEQWAKEKAYITLEQYLEVCRQKQIPEKERALYLSQYLHDLGTFLHFQDHSLLKKTIVLQNEWATDAVYMVLDNETIKAAHGRFSYAMVQDIWKDSRYCDMHDELLALMREFELCYPLEDSATKSYMIPQLLPISKPADYQWNKDQNLQLRYKYHFMPKGLLSRFIVRLHRYIKDIRKAWKSGVVLQKGGTLAEVVELYGQKEIAIRVRGKNPKNLMTIIAEEFDLLHTPFGKQLKVDKLIPCNCSTCKTLEDPNYYDYTDLFERMDNHKFTIECKKKPYIDTDIKSLIYDIFEDLPLKEIDMGRGIETTKSPVKIFISYSHEDEEYKEQLDTHLASLKRPGKVVVWEDGQIGAGSDWRTAIFDNLETADIILLLISASFIDSEFCYSEEMKAAIKRHDKGEAIVIPVLLRDCDWEGLPFASLQSIPRNNKPIAKHDDSDEAYTLVVQKIKKVIQK